MLVACIWTQTFQTLLSLTKYPNCWDLIQSTEWSCIQDGGLQASSAAQIAMNTAVSGAAGTDGDTVQCWGLFLPVVCFSNYGLVLRGLVPLLYSTVSVADGAFSSVVLPKRVVTFSTHLKQWWCWCLALFLFGCFCSLRVAGDTSSGFLHLFLGLTVMEILIPFSLADGACILRVILCGVCNQIILICIIQANMM